MNRPSLVAWAATLGLIVLAAPGGPAVAAGATKQSAGPSTKSTTIFHRFAGLPMVGITNHGNIVTFEAPPGFEHIGIGAVGEGYVLCYGSVNAYDVGGSESGFGTSSASCKGSSCTITRKTSDGKLEFKQAISTGNADRSARFVMTIKNLTKSSIPGLVVRRQADLDVDTGGSKGTGDFTNDFGASEREMVVAWNAINASGSQGNSVSLTPEGLTPTFAKVTDSILESSCSPTNIAANGPVRGDYGGTLEWRLGSLPGGASKTITAVYRRN